MAATTRINYPNNTALRETIWTMPIAEAKALRNRMKANGRLQPGTYWEANLARPVNVAIRHKLSEVTFRTAGFSDADFANMIRECEIEIVNGGIGIAS